MQRSLGFRNPWRRWDVRLRRKSIEDGHMNTWRHSHYLLAALAHAHVQKHRHLEAIYIPSRQIIGQHLLKAMECSREKNSACWHLGAQDNAQQPPWSPQGRAFQLRIPQEGEFSNTEKNYICVVLWPASPLPWAHPNRILAKIWKRYLHKATHCSCICHSKRGDPNVPRRHKVEKHWHSKTQEASGTISRQEEATYTLGSLSPRHIRHIINRAGRPEAEQCSGYVTFCIRREEIWR